MNGGTAVLPLNDVIQLVAATLIIICYWQAGRIALLVKGTNYERTWRWIVASCQIRYRNLFTSILLPIIVMGGFWWLALCQWGVKTSSNSSFVSFTFTPVFEEFLFRGVLFGLFFIVIPAAVAEKRGFKLGAWKWTFVIFGILVTSIVFSLMHQSTVDIRYAYGVLFATFYLIDRQNLLPAIIGHATSNLIVHYIHTCSI